MVMCDTCTERASSNIFKDVCDFFVGGEYVDSSTLGTGYQYGYGGGAMKSAGYAAKAPGPYGGVKSILA